MRKFWRIVSGTSLVLLTSCTALFYPADAELFGLNGPTFDPDSEFNDLQEDEGVLRRAYLGALFSSIVYRDPTHAEETLRSMGISKVRFIDVGAESTLTDGQALVSSIGDYTIVCFRGTVSGRDWMSVLDMGAVKMDAEPHLRTHKGITIGWYDLRREVYDALHELGIRPNGKRQKILVTGHSQGGAIAGLAAMELFAKGYNVISASTFGSPKFSKEDFDPPFEFNRFIYFNDGAARLPPGFKHIGRGIYSRHYGALSRTEHTPPVLFSVSNHFMVHYLNTLSQHLLARSNDPATGAVIDWATNRSQPLHVVAGIKKSEAHSFVRNWLDG